MERPFVFYLLYNNIVIAALHPAVPGTDPLGKQGGVHIGKNAVHIISFLFLQAILLSLRGGHRPHKKHFRRLFVHFCLLPPRGLFCDHPHAQPGCITCLLQFPWLEFMCLSTLCHYLDRIAG